MVTQTAQRVTYLYELMGSACDAEQIHKYSEHMGHITIIDITPSGLSPNAQKSGG